MRFSTLLVAAFLATSVAAQPASDSLDAETLDALPDRTAEALGGLLLVSGDDPELLPLDYRGTGGIQPVVDGLRARRTGGLPQAALLSLTVPTGYVSPRLGGALGAFVEVETRDAPRGDLGLAEGQGGLDAYGYGRASAAAGLTRGRIRLYGAGTFERADDLDPRAYGTPVLPADELEALREAPQVIRVDRALADASGFDPERARYTSEDSYYVPLPPTLEDSSAPSLAAAFGIGDPDAIVSVVPISSLAVRSGEVPLETAAPSSEGERFRGHLALEAALSRDVRLRLSGQGFRETGRAFSPALAFAAPEVIPSTREEAWRGAAEVEAALGSGSLTVMGSVETASSVRYDGRFSDSIEEVPRYGDIDDPANAVAARYRQAVFSSYVFTFRDGQVNPASPYSTFAAPGTAAQGFARETASSLQFAGAYRQRVGDVEVALGAEAERQTLRGVELSGPSAIRLALYAEDGDVEIPSVDTDGNGIPDAGAETYADLPADVLRNRVRAYGYDYLGLEAVSSGTSVEDYEDAFDDNTLAFAPRRPSYAAGFAEGTWQRGGLTLRGGLRVAAFSSNATALFDPFAAVDLYRAEDLAGGSITDPLTGERILAPGGGVPAGVEGSAALYVQSGTDEVVGYRDVEGTFYDASGAAAEPLDVLQFGRPVTVGGGSQGVTADAVTDAPTSIRLLPRMAVEFQASSSTTLTAFVNAFARQPDPGAAFPTLAELNGLRSGVGFAPNGALRPETLTEVGASVRQILGHEEGVRGEVGATLFLRRYQDRARLETLAFAFPSGYTTFVNGPAEEVPGATLHARVQTGRLDARGAVTVRQEPYEEAVLALSGPFTRDVLAADGVVMFTLATEPTDGPALASVFPLGDLRLGAVLRVASGDPYLPRDASRPLAVPFEDRPATGTDLQRGPTRARLDLRLARALRLGPTALEASVEVVNVLGRTNALLVYPTTGLPDDDGFLATDPSQVVGLGTEAERAAYRALYSARARDPLNVGRPRIVRLGLRLLL